MRTRELHSKLTVTRPTGSDVDALFLIQPSQISMISNDSISDTRSSHEQFVDPFALLELYGNVEEVNSKVDNVNTKVKSREFEIDLVIKSLSEIKSATLSKLDRANQFDQPIFLQLKRTLEEANERHRDNLTTTSPLSLQCSIFMTP
ncbi:unnamed protein product [Lactuca saligna]|uniref:Uncharacterized protein n=1 Tax=Lactuca saligna TaxID=75948 RepID=A0AA35V6L6_LACSI|nr:unnamed protein product [Lactuca saligna]